VTTTTCSGGRPLPAGSEVAAPLAAGGAKVTKVLVARKTASPAGKMAVSVCLKDCVFHFPSCYLVGKAFQLVGSEGSKSSAEHGTLTLARRTIKHSADGE